MGDTVLESAVTKAVYEIERKFIVPLDYHERLQKLGFQLVNNEELLVDDYYDFAEDLNTGKKYLHGSFSIELVLY